MLTGSAERPSPSASGWIPAAAAALLLALGGAAPAAARQEGGAGRAEEEAGAIQVEASLDRSVAALGEPVILSVTATHPPGLSWEPRSAGDRLGPFDILQISGPETAQAGPGSATTHWTFRLTAFELGELELPPLELRYTRDGAPEVASVTVEAGSVTIQARVEDPNAEAADIRWGFSLPPPGRLLLWLAAAAGLAALGAALWLWRRRRRRAAPERAREAPAPPGPPPRPAYDRYLEALEALLARGLIESGRIKEFHIGLAEIIKGYLGEVFAFDAVDRTSLEVLDELERVARPTLRLETSAFLGQCDMVKFAEERPGAGECQEAIGRARKILEMGRPVATPPPGSHAGRAGGGP